MDSVISQRAPSPSSSTCPISSRQQDTASLLPTGKAARRARVEHTRDSSATRRQVREAGARVIHRGTLQSDGPARAPCATFVARVDRVEFRPSAVAAHDGPASRAEAESAFHSTSLRTPDAASAAKLCELRLLLRRSWRRAVRDSRTGSANVCPRCRAVRGSRTDGSGFSPGECSLTLRHSDSA